MQSAGLCEPRCFEEEQDPILLSDVFSCCVVLCCVNVFDCHWAAPAAFVMSILPGVRQIVGLQWAAGGPGHLFPERRPQKVVINSDQVADDRPSQWHNGHTLHDCSATDEKVCSTSATSCTGRELSSRVQLFFKYIFSFVVFYPFSDAVAFASIFSGPTFFR